MVFIIENMFGGVV